MYNLVYVDNGAWSDQVTRRDYKSSVSQTLPRVKYVDVYDKHWNFLTTVVGGAR